MIHELRLYQIAPGRMGDIHGRFHHHVPELFDRHGIKNVGRWTGISGSLTPLFVYLMSYEDLNERERAWAAFYADEDWLKVRNLTNAGSEIVSRFTILLLRTSPAWLPARTNTHDVIGGVHELVLQQVAIGQKTATEAFIREKYIPAVEEAGGTTMLVDEIISGSDLPQFAMMFSWPSAQVQFDGRSMLDRNQLLLDAAQRSTPACHLFERAQVLVLEPTAYALPLARLGRE